MLGLKIFLYIMVVLMLLKADIIYMLEDYSGLEEGWCILGIKVRPEEKRS